MLLLMTRIARTMLVPALVTLALPGGAGAQLTKAGVVTTLQGTATVARAAAPQPVPLKFKDTVFVQDRITTGDDSVARILLGGKAIVTVRERSVLTITEVPGTSTIDLGIGKIALAVVKERMKSGETIEIRTPNAVAGIRGTVVITEVDQKTAQLGAGAAAFTSRFTVLQGVVAVSQYNPVTRQLGPTVNLGALQTTGITGSAAPRPPVTLTPEAAKQLASEYKTTIKEAPPAANAAVTNAQVQQAVSHVGSVLGTSQAPRSTEDSVAKSGGTSKSDVTGGGAGGAAEPSTGGGSAGGALANTSAGSSGAGEGLSRSSGGVTGGEKGVAVGGSSGSSGNTGAGSLGGGSSASGGDKGSAAGGGSSNGEKGRSSGGTAATGRGGALSLGGGGSSGGGGAVSSGGSGSSGSGGLSGVGGSSGRGGGLSLGGGTSPGGGGGVSLGSSGSSGGGGNKISGDDLKKHSESKGSRKKK